MPAQRQNDITPEQNQTGRVVESSGARRAEVLVAKLEGRGMRHALASSCAPLTVAAEQVVILWVVRTHSRN
jgi:cell division inhibitor SulA